MSVRQRWASAAIPLAGLHAPEAAFSDVVGPERIEGRGLSQEMMHMWCCALAWLGLARMMGVGNQSGDPELERTYVIGNAMTDVINVFRRHGAWFTYKPGGPLPHQGDCVIIGPGGYHCRGCLITEPDASGAVDLVEGGHQNAAGQMSIERVSTRLFVQDGSLYCGMTASTSTKVYGWGDVSALPIEGGADDAGENVTGNAGDDVA